MIGVPADRPGAAPGPSGVWVALNTLRLSLLRRTVLHGAICRGPAHTRSVALTFDDGPDPEATPPILEALERAGARATFFCCGAAAEREPELLREAARRNEIGTHLFSHGRRMLRSREVFDDEVRRSLEVHERVLGCRPTALRFPFGDPGRTRAGDLRRWGLTAYHWSFSSGDSSATSAGAIVRHVVARLHPGAIVLLHDGRGPNSTRGSGSRRPTIEALPRILEAAGQRGLALVGVSELCGPGPEGAQAFRGPPANSH